MNKKALLMCLLFLTPNLSVFAQRIDGSSICSEQKLKTPITGAKTTAVIPEVEYYDITRVKFDIALTNTTTYVQGVVTTNADVVATSMSVYTFELNNSLTIDSVKINGVLSAVTTTGNVRKVTMPTSLSNGMSFDAEVYYHGSTTPGTGQFFTGGLNPVTTTDGFKLMYSLSDKDLACDWWPCKQTLQDKIDRVEMWVTVDDTLKVGSNGLQVGKVSLPGKKMQYQWETTYPIDYYLISVAVAPYSEYNYYMHFTDGSNDSMLIQNFVYNTPGHFTPAAKAALDSTGLIVDYFSKLFGRYPFDKEKYGHCISPLSGGMEHQTMTTMGTGAYSNVSGLIAHELGHQWWGNHVTYGSWRDIWLSEGITSYCEQLFVEHFHGPQAFLNYRTTVFNGSFSSGGTVYVDDTSTVSRIFNGTLTYNKGASVTHMLRYIAPNDSLFFSGLRAYQQAYSKGIAFTNDLKNILEQVYNTDLDTFFAHWIYGAGYPSYSAKWYQSGQKVAIQIKQTTSSPASVPCFKMPLEIKLKTSQGDRIVKVDNTTNLYTYIISCDSAVTGIEIDPNNHILNGTGSIVKDESVMNIHHSALPEIQVYPNPATNVWQISNLPANSHLLLMDITGKVLWQQDCGGTADIPAKNLANGNYILSVHTDENISAYIRLIKY